MRSPKEEQDPERPPAIDLWDLSTFDTDLLGILEVHGPTLDAYFESERRIFLGFDLERDQDRPMVRPDNPFSGDHVRIWENLAIRMDERIIRSWHYTRLTDAEVEVLRMDGIHPSSPESLRRRLDAIVREGGSPP